MVGQKKIVTMSASTVTTQTLNTVQGLIPASVHGC